MLWPPICFWPTNQKLFSGFAGFNIDDITRFFTLAGNVLQHIWQSFSLSAPSPNRFYDTLHFPGFFLSRYPSFIHTSLPSSLTLLLWQRCPGPFLLTSSTALHTDRTKGLSLHQSGYLCADAPSKRWWSWSQCNIKRAWEGKLLNQILTIWPLGSEWFCYSERCDFIHSYFYKWPVWMVNFKPLFLHSDFMQWYVIWAWLLTNVVWVIWSKSFTPTLLFKSLGLDIFFKCFKILIIQKNKEKK